MTFSIVVVAGQGGAIARNGVNYAIGYWKYRRRRVLVNKHNIEYTERNGQDVAKCPYCSLYYPLMDEKEIPLEVPDVCRRCGSPMDYAKAKAFSDEQAAIASDPRLHELGQRMRGEKQVEAPQPPLVASTK